MRLMMYIVNTAEQKHGQEIPTTASPLREKNLSNEEKGIKPVKVTCDVLLSWIEKKNTPAHKITSCQICRYKSVSVCM